MDFRNIKVTVVGLGESGVKSALLLFEEGAVVNVTDGAESETVFKNAALLKSKCLETEIGKHTAQFLNKTNILVVSPGVEDGSLPIRYAEENGIPVISELELGFLFCKGPIIGITGTNGKSTVCTLLGDILREGALKVNVCGNIGNALSGEVKKITKNTTVVLEVSSFQLERIKSFRPAISVILNVTEDHLDRYKTFQEYLDAKKKIFCNQNKNDIIILNYDDPVLKSLAKTHKFLPRVLFFSAKEKVEGAYVDKGEVFVTLKKKTKRLFSLPGSGKAASGALMPGLKGAHNMENVLACALVATLRGVKSSHIEKALKNFKPLAHRLETVATIDGIEFVDDSKATNIDSTCRALESPKKRVILIAGGKDKNLSYDKMAQVIKKTVKTVILIGETKSKMKAAFGDHVPVQERNTLHDAVIAAFESASPGDSVLLSPMCSSFDMFRDYRHRGEVFREAVMGLRVKGKNACGQ